MSHESARYEQSFGIVPLKKIEGSWHVLLIRHARAKFWGFPKGHPEMGETGLETAVRELKEETNLDVVRLLSDSVFEERYQFRHQGHLVNKTVSFYVAEVSGDIVLQEIEVSGSKWVILNLAEEALTYEADKGIIKMAMQVT